MTLIAIGQLTSTAALTHNLAQCQSLITKAVAAGAKALFLPEAADYIAPSASESVALAQPLHTSPFVLGIREAARQNSLAVCVGVHEPAAGGKVSNSLLWIGEDGVIAQRYRKLHLFDVDVPGGPVIKESDSTEAGTEIVQPFNAGFATIGLAICFDLRFPELALTLRNRGANLLTYPSAFAVATGEAHWHTLLKATAIMTQSYVVAAAQVGKHNEKRRSYGHAMVVDPWGKVLVELSGEDGEAELGVAEVDVGLVESVRRGMPLEGMRRGDVYGEL